MTRRPALLILDLINDLAHPEGSYADVCLDQIIERGVIERAATAIARARSLGIPVIHIVVGFSAGYPDWPAGSPLFAEARDGERLVLGSWGTQVHDALKPAADEPVIAKRRVSPFLGTHLDLLLRTQGVDTLLLTGCAHQLTVLNLDDYRAGGRVPGVYYGRGEFPICSETFSPSSHRSWPVTFSRYAYER